MAFMSTIRHFPQRLLGIFLRAILPGHHLNQDYKDVVKL
jgi:phosphatidate phosphatase APP1